MLCEPFGGSIEAVNFVFMIFPYAASCFDFYTGARPRVSVESARPGGRGQPKDHRATQLIHISGL